MAKTIKGLDELTSKLRKIKALKDNPESLLAGGFVLEKGMKERAAVDTGFMRDSITTEKTDKGSVTKVGANYGYYQEFGSAHNKSQPFVRPTIDEDGDHIVDAVANDLQKRINDVAKGGG